MTETMLNIFDGLWLEDIVDEFQMSKCSLKPLHFIFTFTTGFELNG